MIINWKRVLWAVLLAPFVLLAVWFSRLDRGLDMQRGMSRTGMSPDVPAKLPSTVKLLWRRGLTGAGLSGVAATATRVVVANKSEQKD
jgi:hypothetical protein